MMLPPEKPKPTLEDLFALKRSEKPSAEFWDTFQAEFHVRQRAAAVEPRRWWFVLPRVFVGLSRYQMPVGAAAVLAVTFLSFREYREPGLEIAYMPAAPLLSESATPAVAPSESPELVANAVMDASASNALEYAVSVDVPASASGAAPVSLSPMVVWAGVAANRGETVSDEPSPSARSIAANMAAVRAEQPQLSRFLSEPRINLTSSAPVADPLADVSVTGSAREPLFAYQPAGSSATQLNGEAEPADIPSRIASRLSDDLLYDSVRRLTAGGDRLTLKF